MEGIRGKQSYEITASVLAEQLAGYSDILVDIGTGDGRYVRHAARTCPMGFAIGIDTCRENLRAATRAAPHNALFIIADAQVLPRELCGLATRITINFPWGSLMAGRLDGDSALLDGLVAIARPRAALEIRLNGGALAAVGWSLEAGGEQVRRVLLDKGFAVGAPAALDARALRACPTTWAKRLAFGRDPLAVCLRATRPTFRSASHSLHADRN